MNKNLYKAFVIYAVFSSSLLLSMDLKRDTASIDSVYTGPVVYIAKEVPVDPSFAMRLITFDNNPLRPSTYLSGCFQPKVGLWVDRAAGLGLAAAVCLSTKSGRDFAGKAAGVIAKPTSEIFSSPQATFALGALIGGAVVHTWYQKVGEPEIIEETRLEDFTREKAPQDLPVDSN